jgi:uncharacterized protein (UPF0332 family)
VSLRRAVSAAYYSLFHGLVSEATNLLVSQAERRSPRYLLVYRSFEHGQMLKSCELIAKQKPPARLGVKSFGQEVGSVATAFINLQSQRHRADYDPQSKFAKNEVDEVIQLAQSALTVIREAPASERKIFLTFLLLKGRD